MFSLDRYDGTCNTFDELSKTTCVTNKTEDMNLNFFNPNKAGLLSLFFLGGGVQFDTTFIFQEEFI